MNTIFRKKVLAKQACVAIIFLLLFGYQKVNSCEIVCGSGNIAECEAEAELKKAELSALKSDSVSVAEIDKVTEISSGKDKGKYRVSFTVKRTWSRDRPKGQLVEKESIRKITMLIPRSICNGPSIREGSQYWLFLQDKSYVDHFDIFYSYFHPRSLLGFVSTN